MFRQQPTQSSIIQSGAYSNLITFVTDRIALVANPNWKPDSVIIPTMNDKLAELLKRWNDALNLSKAPNENYKLDLSQPFDAEDIQL